MNQANSQSPDLAALLHRGIAELQTGAFEVRSANLGSSNAGSPDDGRPSFAPLDLSTAQEQQLLAFVGLLAKWNKVYNLTAVRDPAQMISHHLLDSLAPAFAFAQAERVLDVGSGGGLPGMVLAIVYPHIRFSLIDIVHKKTAFLTQAKAELGLGNVTVHTGRVEQLRVDKPFDVITSRAFAELADFVTAAGHLLAENGQFIAMKGVIPTDEMAVLPPQWQVSAVVPVPVPQLNAQRHLIHISPTLPNHLKHSN